MHVEVAGWVGEAADDANGVALANSRIYTEISPS